MGFFRFWPLISPARGRKHSNGLFQRSRKRTSFWPLISPQGDGNTGENDDNRQTEPERVLALNFPARGRKLTRFDIRATDRHEWFWPLISPQGDGNLKNALIGRDDIAPFWPLISPQGDGNIECPFHL